MKKAIVILSMLFISVSSFVKAQENKVSYKFGGFIEFKSYFDDYRSRVSRYDHIYFYPLAPKLNTAGEDLNSTNSLNASVATSRLSFTVSGIKLLNADITSYIEADFTGSAEAYIGMLNIRHAYFNMKWEKSSLLFGQTSHLTMVNEVTPSTVAFGAGYPFNPLNRNMQVQYTASLSKNAKLVLAASMFSGHNSLGPAKAQAQAGLPNLQAQLKFGDPAKVFGGLTFSYKLLKPRTADAQNNLISTTIGSYDINAFFRANLGKGFGIKWWGIYGENLSHLGIIGGYGRVDNTFSSNSNELLDYKYDNIKSYSTWLDIDLPSAKNFSFGIFAGLQKNLGTDALMDKTMASGDYTYGYYKDPNLVWFSRISPRIVYNLSKKLIFGVEYSLSNAQWAKSTDMKFRADELHPVNHNNRLEFIAKYSF